MSLARPIPADELDLARWLRAGDRILVGQGSGEAASLTRRLPEASLAVPRLTVCVGMMLQVPSQHRHLSFESYGALGAVAKLPQDALTILPLNFSQYVARLVDGRLHCDVVFVQLSSPDENGTCHLGMGDLHLIEVARRARVVIAEINPTTPRTPGGEWPSDVAVHVAVQSDTPPPETAADMAGEVEEAIAARIAELVPDRAVLQFGIGRLPNAIARALSGHRDLGLHSGVISETISILGEAGALTNAAKEIDTGLSVGEVVVGGPATFMHIDGNGSVALRPASHTHSSASIARLSRFTAINSAVEVDLFGQVNTETAAGRRIGAIGGQADYTRAAAVSPGGRAIIALPSTGRGGNTSRIVPRVATVSLARTDADTVVTEWGVAELQGVPLERRAERLIAIADPKFRDDLARQWHDQGRLVDA